MATRTLYLLLAMLVPTVAYASFNAAPCGSFECHFEVMGILLGVIGGLPASGLIGKSGRTQFLRIGIAYADSRIA